MNSGVAVESEPGGVGRHSHMHGGLPWHPDTVLAQSGDARERTTHSDCGDDVWLRRRECEPPASHSQDLSGAHGTVDVGRTNSGAHQLGAGSDARAIGQEAEEEGHLLRMAFSVASATGEDLICGSPGRSRAVEENSPPAVPFW